MNVTGVVACYLGLAYSLFSSSTMSNYRNVLFGGSRSSSSFRALTTSWWWPTF